MLPMIVAATILAASICLLVLAGRVRRSANRYLLTAERGILDAASKELSAQAALAAARNERELAGVMLTRVKAIEESLVHPRFALNRTTGRVRALRASELPDAVTELLCARPDDNCRKCFGKGWDRRFAETGEVVPCACIRRTA